MYYQYCDDHLYICFQEELDHMNISKLKDQCIDWIHSYQPQKIYFDFKDVEFVDSSGIGFLLARYKQIQPFRGEIILCNVRDTTHKIFEMSGLFLIMKEEKI